MPFQDQQLVSGFRFAMWKFVLRPCLWSTGYDIFVAGFCSHCGFTHTPTVLECLHNTLMVSCKVSLHALSDPPDIREWLINFGTSPIV